MNPDTIRNVPTYDESKFFADLFRGRFKAALYSIGVSRAHDRLINLKDEYQHGRIYIEPFLQNPDPKIKPLLDFLTAKIDTKSGYGEYRNIFKLLKAAGFSQQDVSTYTVNQLISGYREKAISGLDWKHSKPYTRGIVDAFREVYTS